jgi:hypothetical protein
MPSLDSIEIIHILSIQLSLIVSQELVRDLKMIGREIEWPGPPLIPLAGRWASSVTMGQDFASGG